MIIFDDIHVFVHGFVLALGLILPLGPQNTIVINQGASSRTLLSALPIVITAAMSDTILIFCAIFGLSAVLYHAQWLQEIILLLGSIVLAYIGYKTWQTPPSPLKDTPVDNNLKEKIILTLAASLLNPYAFLDIVAVIGTSAMVYDSHQRSIFVTSCILVSWLWFFALACLGRVIRKSVVFYQIQHYASAIIIWGSGCYLLYRFVIGFK